MDRQPGRAPVSDIVVDDSACESDDLAFCGGVQVTVPGASAWGDLVDRAVDEGWVGIEALGGVRGTVADAVRGNARAHGQAVADTLASVRTWDRQSDSQRTFAVADCRVDGDAPLRTRLPDGRERFDILDATFLFRQGDLTAPIHDEGLAERLGIGPGSRATLAALRDAAQFFQEDR